ncbi:MAG TPA: hypothetical protein VJN21_06320 [Candidatus Acidoferrales bacterium]|nr:hypothetical protein [Candidatus Acidoferrales bacterium]
MKYLVRGARRSIPGLLAACLLLCGPNYSVASPAHRAQMESASSRGLAPDKGKFRDKVNGHQVGTEEFETAPDAGGWVARATAEVKDDKGASTHITSLLRLRADGTPIHYEWSTDGPKKASSTIDFANGTATIQLMLPGKNPFTQQLFFKTPRVAILDDNLYHQYAILSALYDWSRKGPQDLSVLIPQELTPGSVTMEALEPDQSSGKTLDRLRVHSQDLELTLYFDGPRLVRISVPSANAEIVRE